MATAICVSYVHGIKFTKSAITIASKCTQAGFHRCKVYTEEDLQSLDLFKKNFYPYWHRYENVKLKRPYCDAFKWIIILAEMKRLHPEDLIMWIDSAKEKYPSPQFSGWNVHYIAGRLDEQRRNTNFDEMGAHFFGTWHLGLTNKYLSTFDVLDQQGQVGKLKLMEHVFPGAMKRVNQTHVLASHMLIKNSKQNQRLIGKLFQISRIHPEVHCATHVEDQLVLTLLLQHYRIATLSVSKPDKPDVNKMGQRWQKGIDLKMSICQAGNCSFVRQ